MDTCAFYGLAMIANPGVAIPWQGQQVVVYVAPLRSRLCASKAVTSAALPRLPRDGLGEVDREGV
jgi:hypothetical protein